MIEIYSKENTNYEMNGDIVLDPNSCIYKESEKLITLEHDIDNTGRWEYLKEENVVSIERNDKKQLFRIYSVDKNLDCITVYARPLYFDLIDSIMIDTRPTNVTCQEAANQILKGTKFSLKSDLDTRKTAHYIRKNKLEAILSDDDNSLIVKWGGEFDYDNFNLYLNERIGYDRGKKIEFGYNLEAIESNVNIENVATRIIPVGYDGIVLVGDKPWVDSDLINKYTHIKTRVIQYDDVKVKSAPTDENEEGFKTVEEAREELKRRCRLEFENGIDKPCVNYKINMIDLENHIEYENYKELNHIGKGDSIYCNVPGLDISITARVIDFERDELTGEYLTIELGNVTSDFFIEQADVRSRLDNILDVNGDVLASELSGFINSTKTKIVAQKNIAQKQHVRAMLFEDLDNESDTFGAVTLGTLGIMCSQQRTLDNLDWEYTSALTSEGLIAEKIVGEYISDKKGNTYINMKDGTVKFTKGKISGPGLVINLDTGSIDFTKGKITGGSSSWDLDTGIIELTKGKIIGSNSSWDLDTGIIDLKKGKITGASSSWDLDTGIINFTKGKIKGKNSSWDLDSGKFSSKQTYGGQTYDIQIEGGKVLSEYYLSFITTGPGVGMEKRIQHGSGFTMNSVYCYDWGIAISAANGKRFQVIAGESEFIGNVKITGDLTVTGKVKGPIHDGNGNLITPGGTEEQTKIVNSARELIGKPYVFGGNYPPLGSDSGTDCSGLIQWAFNQNGIRISRTTYTQINEGVEVSEADLQPGDLIFSNFSSPGVPEHVFLYSGKVEGQHMCVEAPRTGLNIRERSFIWGNGYRARRLLNTPKTLEEKINELENRIRTIEERGLQ